MFEASRFKISFESEEILRDFVIEYDLLTWETKSLDPQVKYLLGPQVSCPIYLCSLLMGGEQPSRVEKIATGPHQVQYLSPLDHHHITTSDMALPPNSPFRGVAAAIPQPAPEEDIDELKEYITGLTLYNSQGPSILYRDPNNDQDIVEAVFEDYYNLERHVNGGGAPADTSPADGSVFVSTTRSASWRPRVTTDTILYRYEIFAPGGIDTVLTLREHNDYPNQQEIAFVGGISPQYIRTARPYAVVVSPESQFPIYVPYDDRIYRNGRFNPNPTSSNEGQTTQEFMNRLRNVRCGENMINLVFTRQQHRIEKRETEKDTTTPLVEEKYVDPICGVGHYIECAFNFSNSEEAYLFIADQCLQINYAPGTTNDKIIKGPMSIGDGLPYLKDTIFVMGLMLHLPLLEKMRRTIFEHGIDAAFASSKENEAYIFKGDQYALINFAPGTTEDSIIQGPKRITLSFPSLKETIFQDGFDAAFSSSEKNEAYIFKGNTYALINYAPGTTGDYIINGPITPISDGFRSLKDILPMYPCRC
ncbi:albumin-2 protein [Cinnamomum micranthum f. kanehirae]|uniref:Albumin-2 protein n=1 Tax=Cinnamomum micranthum f. kanehirae TaxID=337451 RepID=A0A443P1H9_9MAGN|nr:albumin-2 protein [Cinnamomum micranthum f. kanehirae]